MNTVRAASVRGMPPGTSSRNRLATPVTCRRCGMNTVRAASVRAMPPATEEIVLFGVSNHEIEVAV
jgi:hypothetical protein